MRCSLLFFAAVPWKRASRADAMVARARAEQETSEGEREQSVKDRGVWRLVMDHVSMESMGGRAGILEGGYGWCRAKFLFSKAEVVSDNGDSVVCLCVFGLIFACELRAHWMFGWFGLCWFSYFRRR
jgi:hypothetical protein